MVNHNLICSVIDWSTQHVNQLEKIHLGLLEHLSAGTPWAIQTSTTVPGPHCLSLGELLSYLPPPSGHSHTYHKEPFNQSLVQCKLFILECITKSWSLILFFYLLFHGFLAALFSLTMGAMLQTLNNEVPSYCDHIPSPGLVVFPKPEIVLEYTICWIQIPMKDTLDTFRSF